jgi:hypothetical protein
MAEKHEITPYTMTDTSRQQAVDLNDMPMNTEGFAMSKKQSQTEYQRTSCLKSTSRYSNLRSSELVSRRRVSFNEDVKIIPVKSYKLYNKPEYMYAENKCCGNRCVVF